MKQGLSPYIMHINSTKQRKFIIKTLISWLINLFYISCVIIFIKIKFKGIIILGDGMFFSLFCLAILQIIVYESIGSVIKRFFKFESKYMNLIIGYLFSLLIFYLIHIYFILNHYPYAFFTKTLFPIYLVMMLIFAFFSIKRKNIYFDYIVIIIIIVYIYHFFTLAFILPGEATHYLSLLQQNINQSIDLTVFQTYTLLHASFFQINSTIYTVNVMTFIHLFIILYTLFECCCVFFTSTKKCRYAFLFLLLLFTIVNSNIREVIIPFNAYDFIYFPFTGRAIYLYAIIPFQFTLFYRLERKNYFLLLLINLSCMGFTSISLFMQLILNLAFSLTLMIMKSYHFPLLLVTIFPLFFHLIVYTYQPNINLIFFIVFCLLTAYTALISYQRKYPHKSVLLYASIGFLILLLGLYYYLYTHLKIGIKEELILPLTDRYKHEHSQFYLFYGLSIYALLKLSRANLAFKRVLFYLPIIVVILLINPVTAYFLFSNQIPYTYLFFLMPLSFSILYLMIKRTRIIEKLIILLLIVGVQQSIYEPLIPINLTNQNPYYRIDNEVLSLGEYLNQNQELKNILVEEQLVNEISVVTKNINILVNYQNIKDIDKKIFDENILMIYFMINDKIPFDLLQFIELIDLYDIDAIIVDKNKTINPYLNTLSMTKKDFDYYIIYTY